MTDLLTLIDKLEKAEAGSRELDEAVYCQVCKPTDKARKFVTDLLASGAKAQPADAPPYTRSLDAVALLEQFMFPVGLMLQVSVVPQSEYNVRCDVLTLHGGGWRKAFMVGAATEPLARAAALLKALHAKEQAR